MSHKYNILYNNVQQTGLINSRLLCSLYYFWEDKYFPKLIQLEKVVQVQLDNEQELQRHLKSQMNLQKFWCPYMDTN